MGGIDVVTELIENDEFDEMIPKSCKPLPPKEQALKVASENKIVLLLNGTPSAPKDEASKSMVMQIQSMNQPFMYLDVEGQPEYLTAFPKTNIPYLILEGKPACGVDGIEQLGLSNQSPENKKTVTERIEELLKSNEAILFMKGSPSSPECGFSGKIVNILKQYDGFKYTHFNIFEDNEIREGLKKYSNWPTYPQLYVSGKLVGGIDVVQELHDENELEGELRIW